MDPIAVWLSLNPHPGAGDPLQGMQQAGLLDPMPDYRSIGRLKADIVERTGLLGLAGVWGGRQLVGRHFLSFASPAQRAAWQGRGLAVAISEPEVGAHPKHLTTRADPVAGGGFHITGRKAWVSNAAMAEAIIVFAITSVEGDRKRYSAFIVPRGTPGLTMQDMPGFHALRPSRHALLSIDCDIPGDARLGQAGSAYERMALPFRDIEDAVGTFSSLGAVRRGLRGLTTDDRTAKGEIIALATVFGAAADGVMDRLDGGRLRPGDATVAGLRVMVRHLVAGLRALDPDLPILADLDAVLSIARGAHAARLQRLAASFGEATGTGP